MKDAGRGLTTLGLLLLVGCAGGPQTVRDGQLHRVQRLSTTQFEAVVGELGVKTVVNLRGFAPEAGWYREQSRLCERLGVRQIDLAINPDGPDRGDVVKLLDVYRTAPRPILLHSGWWDADARLAAGVFQLAEGDDPADARKQLDRFAARLPFTPDRRYDEFLRDWQGERDFYANYQLDQLKRGRAVLDGRSPPVEQVSYKPADVGLGRPVVAELPVEPADPAAPEPGWREGLKRRGRDLVDRIRDRGPAVLTSAGLRDLEDGAVLSDFGALVPDGPVGKGPVIIGRGVGRNYSGLDEALADNAAAEPGEWNLPRFPFQLDAGWRGGAAKSAEPAPKPALGRPALAAPFPHDPIHIGY